MLIKWHRNQSASSFAENCASEALAVDFEFVFDFRCLQIRLCFALSCSGCLIKVSERRLSLLPLGNYNSAVWMNRLACSRSVALKALAIARPGIGFLSSSFCQTA